MLVFHGSRNKERYLANAVWLNNLVQKKLWQKDSVNLDMSPISHKTAAKETSTIYEVPSELTPHLVELALLEFAEVELSQQIVNFALKAIALNYQKIAVIPVFLSAGVHVTEDIPLAVAEAQQHLQSINIELKDYIGSSPDLVELIEGQFQRFNAEQRILLAHGSRLSQGNVAIEQLGKKANAIVAYWTIQPDLTSIVESIVDRGVSSITTVPYFLFPGKITKAIASLVKELQHKFPQIKMHYGEPLGATPELAEAIAKHIERES